MLTRPSFDLEDSKTILAMSSVNLNAACPSLDKRRTLRIDITNQLLGVLAAAGLNDVWMGDDMPGWNGSVDAKPYAFAESEAVAIIPGLIAIPPNTRNNTDLRTVIAHELSQEPGFDLDSELNHVESETLDPQIVDQAFFADFLTNHLR